MDPRQAALDLLPHGPAFRFLERILTLNPGISATAEYTVRGDEPFLAGHFPDEPLFPGVLLIEGAAQLAGIAAQSSSALPPARLRLTALRLVKIFGTAGPGETIRFEASIQGHLGNLVQAQARAWVGPKVILEAALALSREPMPPPAQPMEAR